VNGFTGPVFLENENAWTLRVVRVILEDLRLFDTIEDFPYHNIVFGEFVVAMFRDSYVPAADQREYLLEGPTHWRSGKGWLARTL